MHKTAINTKYKDYLSYQCKIIIHNIKMLLPTALLWIPPTSNFWITNIFIVYAALLYNSFLNAVRQKIWCNSIDKAKISVRQKCIFRQFLLSICQKMCSKMFWSVIFPTDHSKADWPPVPHIVFLAFFEGEYNTCLSLVTGD